MQNIAPGVYVETDSRGTNLGLVVTKAGPILIDTPLIPREARAWNARVLSITEGRKPIYVINTDHHKGHALGNVFFDSTSVAQEAAWKHMHGYGDNFRQRLSDRYRDKDPETSQELLHLQIQLPALTFEERLTFYMDDRTIRIIHVDGHTPASSLVFVPEARVVFCGDVVVCNMHPFMAQSDTGKWLDALTAIRRMSVDYVVPGHGSPGCGKDSTEPLSDYIRTARAKVRKQFNAGKSKAEAANAVLAEIMAYFPRVPSAGVKLEAKVKSGLGHIYDEFKAEASGAKPQEAGGAGDDE
jgi:cyclase